MFIYLTFALCGLGAATLVYRYDLYDREPLPAAALAVGLGAAFMAGASPLEIYTFRLLGIERVAGLAAVAAIEEEALKLLVVVLFAVFARRTFNDPMDGIIYGSLAGLGAALEEGIAVLRSRPATEILLPPAELVRLGGHLVMGGLGGFGVGRTVTRDRGAWLAVALGFGSAVGLHFGWDLLALRGDPFREGAAPRGTLLGAALMLAGFALYGRLVVVASRWSQGVFSPTAVLTLLGWPWRRSRRLF